MDTLGGWGTAPLQVSAAPPVAGATDVPPIYRREVVPSWIDCND